MFLLTYLFGILFEKIRVPWIFAALFLGALLALRNPFSGITSSDTFVFLAEMGMYFLLFIIGFEINLREIKRNGEFILKATFTIIFLEAFFGSMVIHYVFDYGWFISGLVALSFATVGEAVLIPILDEFNVAKTRFGQLIIGIGSIDDIIEIFVLLVVILLIGSGTQMHHQVAWTIGSLIFLGILTLVFIEEKDEGERFTFKGIENLFLFIMFLFFLFLGVGEYAEATPLTALLAGVGIRHFIPHNRLKLIEREVKTMCYGFFAPIFFLWVGSTMDVGYLLAYPLLVLLVVAVSNSAKLLGSVMVGRKMLGMKKSILLGIGLSVRFSTSIIVIKILFEHGLIDSKLYSVIIASSIAFKFIVPVLFSNLLVKWNIAENG